MAVAVVRVWGAIQRSWGYELRADYLGNDGRVYNETLTFKSAPTVQARDAAVEAQRQRLEIMESEPVVMASDPTDQEIVTLKAEILMLKAKLDTVTPQPTEKAIL